jgi:hypothetical protein
MNPGAALRTYLLNNTGSAITGLIGSGTSARFYPDELPQNAQIPACTYTTITTRNEHVISTVGTADWGRCGFGVARIEVECFSNTRTGSLSLADAIMDYVCGPTQRLRGVYGGVNILDCMIATGPRTYTEPDTAGGDDRRYVTVIEFSVSYHDA